jgi:hypothetical protein
MDTEEPLLFGMGLPKAFVFLMAVNRWPEAQGLLQDYSVVFNTFTVFAFQPWGES